MDNQPLVSVLMGVYNDAALIERSIESIRNQTYQNWELIICDDCSTDATGEAVKRIQGVEARIKYIKHEKNRGLAAALNTCLAKANGLFCARMDADDISVPSRFQQQVTFLLEHDEYAIVGSSVIPFDESGERHVRLINEYPSVNDLVLNTTFYHPTVMVRTQVYQELGGYLELKRTRKGQDVDLWFRLYAHGYKGYNFQAPLLKYHESLNDYKKKRSVPAAWGMVKTRWIGYKLNHLPVYVYPMAIKPLISALIPKRIMHTLHSR